MLREVLQAREKGRRLEEAASDGDDGARDWYDDIEDGIERGVGAAA